ncbi:MAG: CDP-alcohol phosphatidyltransferase family protein [Verrucomicrobiales bacterium]|nr:CDP-alcohol phosphatidyltransferase family protein [Verrucomicrobiales bacterium]
MNLVIDPSDKPKVTCYSEGERGLMQGSQQVRGRLLEPLLRVLAGAGCRPGHLTFLSLLCGLAFVPLFLTGRLPVALGLLLLHVLLDGLDGPLARFAGVASNRGSFTDTMADQMVVTFSTVALIQDGLAGLWPGVLYLFFYSQVVLFAMARNAMAIPYSWLVRPRFFVYGCIPVAAYGWAGTMDALLWLVSALLAWKTLTGFVKIRRRL